MRRAISIVLLAAIVTGCAGLRGPGSDASLELRSSTFVQDANGARILGEIRNVGDANADALRVKIEFRDASNATLDTVLASPWRVLLEHNETSVFDAPAPANATSARVTAVGETTRRASFERQHLEPRDVQTHQAIGSNRVAIEGFAVNAGELPVGGIEVQIAFHDAEGHLVGATRESPESSALAAGASSPFAGNATMSAEFLRYDVTVVTTLIPDGR